MTKKNRHKPNSLAKAAAAHVEKRKKRIANRGGGGQYQGMTQGQLQQIGVRHRRMVRSW